MYFIYTYFHSMGPSFIKTFSNFVCELKMKHLKRPKLDVNICLFIWYHEHHQRNCSYHSSGLQIIEILVLDRENIGSLHSLISLYLVDQHLFLVYAFCVVFTFIIKSDYRLKDAFEQQNMNLFLLHMYEYNFFFQFLHSFRFDIG